MTFHKSHADFYCYGGVAKLYSCKLRVKFVLFVFVFMLSDVIWCEHLRFLLYILGAAEAGDLRYG